VVFRWFDTGDAIRTEAFKMHLSNMALFTAEAEKWEELTGFK